MADHFVHSAEAERGHDLAHLLGKHEAEVDDMLGLASELLAEDGVLRGDADGASVQVALAHHDAPHHDQGGRRHAVLLRAEEGCDRQVATRLQGSVRLHDDPAAQVVQDERLVRLGQSKLPRQTAVLDRRPTRGASTSVVAGDQDVIRQPLGDTRSDHPDAHLRDELHRDARGGVGVLEVRDQLLEVLNGVDIVVGRR